MKNSKEWFSVSELLSENLKDLPSTDKGISKKADREGWDKRQRAGVKGKTFEYNVRSMPENVQQALGVGELPQPSSTTPDNHADAALDAIEHATGILRAALNQPRQADENEGLNNIEWHLVRCYRKAGEDGKVAILNMAESMANLQEKKEEV